MRTRLIVFAVFVLMAGHVFAQAPPRPPQAPAAPAAPAPPAPAANPAAPPPPPPPAPPGPPRREGQPINVRVELNITEDGGAGAPIKKSVTAVVADGYNGFVRQQGFAQQNPTAPNFNQPVPLNFDAFPVILPNGKIRLTCSIQYNAGAGAAAATGETRRGTDIRQNLVLNLESGKALVISQGTDPIGDRRVTVEVTATILR